MKIILTLALSVLIRTFIVGQEFMRLDSITNEVLNYQYIYTTEFTYNNEGRLDSLFNLINEELNFALSYNENGTYKNMEVFTSEDTIVYDFIYDGFNLDTLVAEVQGFKQIVDVEEEDDLIKEIKIIEEYDGNFDLFIHRLYTYNNQKRLLTWEEFDVENSGEILNSYIYTYNNGKFLSRNFTNFNNPKNNFKDTVLYTPEGFMDKYLRLSEKGCPIDEFTIDYSGNKTFQTEDFLNPLDFYIKLFLIFGIENTGIITALQNNELPTQHLTNLSETFTRSTWHYSLFVNNKETRVAAKGIKVHPNPSCDFILLDLDKNISQVDIYSVTGQLVKSKLNNEKKVDISSLDQGSYFILVKTEQEEYFVSKVLKQ